MAYTKEILSASTNGRPIKVVAIASGGTLIHSGHWTAKDEVWLWACNTDTAYKKLTVEFGGTNSPDDTIEQNLQPEAGWIPIIPGHPITSGTMVKAFAATANVVILGGFVNRIS
jgi:hypothetical protein